nr:Mariner Mos1 transposase [Hymenolepis microstoma]
MPEHVEAATYYLLPECGFNNNNSFAPTVFQKMASGNFAVEDSHSGEREKFVEDAELERFLVKTRVRLKKNYQNNWYSPDVAPSADFHLTHFAQWHTTWLTGTSARMKE